jgi:hypothetical protein
MATTLLKFKTDEGEVLIAAPAPDSLVRATGHLEDTVEQVEESLDSALRVVGGVSESFRKVFDRLSADTAEVELGLKFTAKGSVYVVEATGEASLRIKLSFKHAT